MRATNSAANTKTVTNPEHPQIVGIDLAIDDRQLLLGLKSGHRESTEALVRRLEPLLTRMVFRLTGWHADTEDLVQESFLSIQRSADRFQGDSSLETWAVAIAVNCCRSFLRRRKKGRFEPLDAAGVPEDVLIQQREGPQQQAEEREELWCALGSLEHEDRELVVMRYLEEMSLDEMASILGLRKNTLEVRLHRARKRLELVMVSRMDRSREQSSVVKGPIHDLG